MKVLSLVAVVAFAFACNKEKAAVKKLDGTWTMGTGSDDSGAPDCSTGTSTGTSTATWQFVAYEVGDAEKGSVYGTYTWTPTSGTATTTKDTADYSVNDDGTTLTITQGTTSTVYTIVKLTNSALEMTNVVKDVTIYTDCDDLTKTEKKDVTYTSNLTK